MLSQSCVTFFPGAGDAPLLTDKPQLRWVTLGDAVDVGMYENVFGTYSALVKKSSFVDVIQGFSEDYGSTFEDYELLANAVLKGLKLEMIPEALLFYRQNSGSHLMHTTNRYENRLRGLRPYIDAVPKALRNAILMGYGRVKRMESIPSLNSAESSQPEDEQ